MTRRAVVGLAGALFLGALVLEGGTVTGRLVDDAGKPVSGARVVWEPYRTEERRLVDLTKDATPAPAGETATDAEGRFRISLDKPGAGSSLRISVSGLLLFLEGPYESTETTDLEEIRVPAGEKFSGRVTDEAGKPVSGAKVRMSGIGLLDDDERFSAETVTGPDGAFAFPATPESARNVTVRAAGFATSQRARLDRRRSPEKFTLKRGGSIRGTVLDAAGQPAAGAIVIAGDVAGETDASGAYRLEGLAATTRVVEAFWKEDFAARKDAVRVRKGEEVELPLRLTRAATIAGTVVDEKTRRPIAGVSLRAASGPQIMRFGQEPTGVSRRGRSDARGRFRILGLLSQRYAVEARRDGFLPASISGVVPSAQGRSAVALALTPAASVSGRVTTGDGQPVAGARVRLLDRGPLAMLSGRRPASGLFGGEGARTRQDGTYKLRQLAPARSVSLEAAREGFASAKRHGVSLKAGEASRDVNLVLEKGLQARGRVVNAQGEPVAGAEIRISPAETRGMMGVRFVTRMMRADRPAAVAGRDGGFTVAGLEEGDVSATVSGEGYAEKSFAGLSVQAGEPTEWPPFVLAAGAGISGLVRDTQGAPVVGADVGVFGESGGLRQATSELDGSFRLDGLPADKPVMLTAMAPGYGMTQRSVTPPAEALVVTLKTAGVLRGRVEDADTKRPVTDFSVGYSAPRMGGMTFRMGGNTERSFQSADGSFELPDVNPGKWTVRATAAGYRGAEVGGVEVGEGEAREGIVLSLKKGGTLSGRVLDPRRGTGVANADVSWQESAPDGPNRAAAAMIARLSGSNSATATDADGRFRFEGLPEGKVTITASHPDFLDGSKDVASDTEQVDITLSIGGSIAGMVVGRDGRAPAAGAEVFLDPLGESSGGWMGGAGEPSRADAAGNFLFGHLRPGRYRVRAEAPAGKAPPKEVVLTENQRLDGVMLALTGGTAVRGTVTGLPAGSLGGIRISASARDYSDMTTTDEAGRFLLRDVPAGSLRIAATTAMMSGRTALKNFEVPEGAAEFPADIAFEGSSRLAGRITRGERPLAGIFVNASPDPPSPTGARASAQTDEDGRYALEGLSDGRYQVFLGGQGVSYRKVMEVAGDTPGDISLPAATLSGFVTEASRGEPLEGALVRAEIGRDATPFASRQAVSDSRGFYSLEDLDSGTYKITARKDGYQPKEQSVTVASAASELNLALARGGGLEIRVTDGQTGLPLRGVTVSASAGGGVVFSGSVSLDSEGKGEITSLSPGAYALQVFSQGYAPRVLQGVVVPSAPVSVALTPGGRVEVRSAAPVNGRIVDASGAAYLVNPWRTDGRINAAPPLTVWENFAPGSYQLLASTPSGEKSYPFTVTEGRTTTVEVR